MAQLLIALESDRDPPTNGRDNLRTMALVEAAYLSAAQYRSVRLGEIERSGGLEVTSTPATPSGFLSRLRSEPNGLAGGHSTGSRAVEESMANFTPRAQQALALARKEADRFNHNFVGTEHLLLGLIRLGQGVAVIVLQKLGVELENVRREIEKQVGTGPDRKIPYHIPYTPRVKMVLALAAKEAKALNHKYVGTEHLLLGLLSEGDGVAARVLASLNVDVETTRREILKELGPNSDE